METSTKTWALTARAVYLAGLIVCIATGKFQHAVLFAVPFLLTIPIITLAKKEPDYYLADLGFMILFFISMTISYFNVWPLTFSWFSIDKLFHLAAGACVANLVWIYLNSEIRNRRVLYLIIVLSVIGIGAGWEVFEWAAAKLPAAYSTQSTGYDDTMMDLVVDGIGALAIVLYHAYTARKIRDNTWVEVKIV